MICPKCEYEYIDGIKTCPDCNKQLIPVNEFQGKLVNPSDWIIVHTTDELFKAEMFSANLNGSNIETLIINQKDSSYPLVGDLSVVKVLVKKSDAENAVEIIQDILSKNGDDSK